MLHTEKQKKWHKVTQIYGTSTVDQSIGLHAASSETPHHFLCITIVEFLRNWCWDQVTSFRSGSFLRHIATPDETHFSQPAVLSAPPPLPSPHRPPAGGGGSSTVPSLAPQSRRSCRVRWQVRWRMISLTSLPDSIRCVYTLMLPGKMTSDPSRWAPTVEVSSDRAAMNEW